MSALFLCPCKYSPREFPYTLFKIEMDGSPFVVNCVNIYQQVLHRCHHYAIMSVQN